MIRRRPYVPSGRETTTKHIHEENKLFASCPICGEETAEVITSELRNSVGDVYQCTTCSHAFIPPNTLIDLVDYYASDYRREYSPRAEKSPTNASELYETYSKFQQERVEKTLALSTVDSSVLDVGASAGQFATHLIGKVRRVAAIELDPECCEFMRQQFNLDCDEKLLQDSRFSKEKFDLVTSFHVLEHTADPIEFLRIIKSVLAVRGRALIEVPNLQDSLLSEWDLPNHRKFFFHPAHLQYFTAGSLEIAALRAGFESANIQVEYTQDYNVLNHIHWLLYDSPQDNCEIGLSEIHFDRGRTTLDAWLCARLRTLDSEYRAELARLRATSNIYLTLTNG